MRRTQILFPVLASTLLLSACDGAMRHEVRADEVPVSTTVIVPEPKEVVAIPQGYTSCDVVSAGYYNGFYVPAHRVCQYLRGGRHVAWIEGYWACPKFDSTGVCTLWQWKSGHWVSSNIVY